MPIARNPGLDGLLASSVTQFAPVPLPKRARALGGSASSVARIIPHFPGKGEMPPWGACRPVRPLAFSHFDRFLI
jgi:hypothetical protein